MTNPLDSVACWEGKEFKVFVVHLEVGRGRGRVTHTMYVRARAADTAIRVARFHTTLKRPRCHARLATPRDLGCVVTT